MEARTQMWMISADVSCFYDKAYEEEFNDWE